MGSEELHGIRARYADSQAEEVPQAQTTYDSTTSLPVRRVGVFDAAGRQLLWIWTDGRSAAGSLYVSPVAPEGELGRAQRKAKRFVFGMLSRLYMDGVPAAAVIDPAHFEPDYTLGEIRRAPSPMG